MSLALRLADQLRVTPALLNERKNVEHGGFWGCVGWVSGGRIEGGGDKVSQTLVFKMSIDGGAERGAHPR